MWDEIEKLEELIFPHKTGPLPVLRKAEVLSTLGEYLGECIFDEEMPVLTGGWIHQVQSAIYRRAGPGDRIAIYVRRKDKPR